MFNKLIFTPKGNLNKNVVKAFFELISTGMIRPVHCTSRGKWSRNYLTKYGAEAPKYLEYFAVEYVTGNDAPRGGECGQFISLKNAADSFKLRRILEAYGYEIRSARNV